MLIYKASVKWSDVFCKVGLIQKVIGITVVAILPFICYDSECECVIIIQYNKDCAVNIKITAILWPDYVKS
jgi:hypothetical protein